MIERRCGMSIEEMGYFTDRAVRSDRIIYTPTLFAKEALLYLQEVGSLQALKPHQSRKEWSGRIAVSRTKIFAFCGGLCVY